MKINHSMTKLRKTFKVFKQSIIYLFGSSKRLFTFMMLLVMVSGFCVSIKVYIWKKVIDSAFSPINGTVEIKEIATYLVLHFLVGLILNFTNQYEVYISNLFSQIIDCNITEKSLEKIDLLTLAHFEDSKTYDMLQRVCDESSSRSFSIMKTVVQLSRGVVVLTGVSIILWNSSPVIVLICIFISTIVFVLNNSFMEKWYEVYTNRLSDKRLIKILKSMCVKYENIKELQIFNTTKLIRKIIVSKLKVHLKDDDIVRKKYFSSMIVVDGVDHIITYACKSWVLYTTIIKQHTVGSFVAYIQAIDIFKSTVDNVLTMCTQAYEDSLYLESFFNLMAFHIPQRDEAKIETINTIRCVNLSFMYPNTEKHVLKNFSYEFSRGKKYALVGLNGSGKSTLLKLLLGLYTNYEGAIYINDIELQQLSLRNYYKHTSVIFQDFIKYPFDIKTNIATTMNLSSEQFEHVEKVAKMSCAEPFIKKETLAYDTVLSKEWTNGTELSIGQWQKIAIARAFYKKSSVLIMDEPTASVDSDTERNIFRDFSNEVTDKLGIVVTHRLSNINFVDHIVVIDEGQLVEEGTQSSLMMQKGLFYRLYVEQAELYVMNMSGELGS